MSLPEIPETLRRALDAGRVVPFVGAGVSMSVMRKDKEKPLFPSWHELLKRAAERLRRETLTGKAETLEAKLACAEVDYYQCAELAQNALGHQRWRDLLVGLFDPRQDTAASPSLQLGQLVWELGSRLVITTNFDRVLQWTCPAGNDLRRIVIQEPHALQRIFASSGDADRPTVWHLHGHIEEPTRLVLAPDGYQLLYGGGEGGLETKTYEAALTALRHVALAKILLFVGFSLSDQVFVKALAEAHRSFQASGGPHFVLAQESDRPKLEVVLEREGLSHIIHVVGYAHHGEPLVALLRLLANKVAPTKPKSFADIEPSVFLDTVVNPRARATTLAHVPEQKLQDFLARNRAKILEMIVEQLGEGQGASQDPPTQEAARHHVDLPAEGLPDAVTEDESKPLFDDLGAQIGASVEDFVFQISNITTMPEAVVLHQLRRDPEKRVQEIFKAVWPSDEALGDYTVSQVRRWLLTGAVARFVGKPYAEVESRLADEFGQTKIRTVFAERWQRDDDSEESDTDNGSEVVDIETITIAHARRRELAGVIAEITGKQVAWVRRRFQEMHGKTHVMRAFQEYWPNNQELGALRAASCARLGLVFRVARTLDRTPGYVRQRLSVPGDATLRRLFTNEWPAE